MPSRTWCCLALLLGLLLAPALFVPVVMLSLPWATGTELKIAQPAAAMGRFFAENFERRTGRSLKIVTGDLDTTAVANSTETDTQNSVTLGIFNNGSAILATAQTTGVTTSAQTTSPPPGSAAGAAARASRRRSRLRFTKSAASA